MTVFKAGIYGIPIPGLVYDTFTTLCECLTLYRHHSFWKYALKEKAKANEAKKTKAVYKWWELSNKHVELYRQFSVDSLKPFQYEKGTCKRRSLWGVHSSLTNWIKQTFEELRQLKMRLRQTAFLYDGCETGNSTDKDRCTIQQNKIRCHLNESVNKRGALSVFIREKQTSKGKKKTRRSVYIQFFKCCLL